MFVLYVKQKGKCLLRLRLTDERMKLGEEASLLKGLSLTDCGFEDRVFTRTLDVLEGYVGCAGRKCR
jgi:hypothetical protein